ncbi:MAG: hypothetical protein A3F84_28100 [Candidatus Handelsmanbacteria bacterium RIFCSPLOWO2_12_FULL_64_10]|uniref:PDZ domain-containing protein n=1 Tax=Handelsmanbacteria sp. (strain RIFCSPLOWO2_12_FULL_64_10) TaxID=1817868 RepID=A0A1F6CIQ5_HANXR|nr:MAG: hypothetical protein A3F84_28100 [Candidatus Handelsmanbacteria bacterium RIFCSPLOWO2_12_FULL_64_10]
MAELLIWTALAQIAGGEVETTLRRTAEEASRAFVFIGGGSGFIISADGYMLTNDHVATMLAPRAPVQLCDGSKRRARKIATDRLGDVTLLKIEGEEGEIFPFIPMGDSDALEIGQYVAAVGNPFGTGSTSSEGADRKYPTVTLGLVSAMHRYQGTYYDSIQTDAAVNPGNSGGPLITLDGKWVGINGRIATRYGNRVNSGVGYAISQAQIERFIPLMKAAAVAGTKIPEVHHGDIKGVRIDSRSPAEEGVRIVEVREGTSAQDAGFARGDFIVEIGGYPVATRARYRGVVGSFPADAQVEVKVRRGEELVAITVTLDRAGRESEGTASESPPADSGYLGVRLGNAEGGGAEVTDVIASSPAAEAGLQIGDVVERVGSRRVEDADTCVKQVWRYKVGAKVKLKVRRGEEEFEVEIKLAERPKE